MSDAIKTALDALNSCDYNDQQLKLGQYFDDALVTKAIAALEALQAQEPNLESIERYRLQMAAISTASLGYWKEGDSIQPDYDTLALRDVAKLYAKYAALYAAPQPAKQVVAWLDVAVGGFYLSLESIPDYVKNTHKVIELCHCNAERSK